MKNVFKVKQVDKVVIIEAVGLYCRFSLSYREVSEILRHRGILVNPTTIMRWIHQYSKIFFVLWKKKNKPTSTSWRVDETYVKIKGQQPYFIVPLILMEIRLTCIFGNTGIQVLLMHLSSD